MTAYEESRKILGLSTVYQRGKTQIPSDVRKIFSIKDEDKLLWVIENGKLLVERT